ncbi:MAG: helix-turn-helix transcriptional regulator, partial [Actinobacteria bacterium]|nr:helix-turn-helix transcriptional regulator [Actinomycetota bacterium]MBV9662878.1 helix-turn-helix transcriptional regulator [Actinomycetota bacterium]
MEARPALDQRILDATLRCIGRWGVAKTTLEDVAREAGCSRATVYRAVPGGKDGLIEAVA